jgi:PAS domain S-box-containing protein
MNGPLERWLREHDEAILLLWMQQVQERELLHYRGLSSYELQREISPFYECMAAAIMAEAAPAEARLEDWILSQRLNRQCTLRELLQIAMLLKSAIWQNLAEGSDAYQALQAGQTMERLFDQATVILASLFTRAIEQTLEDRLQEAEFMTQSLASATEEADQALQRTRLLYDVSRVLAATLDLGEVLQVSATEMAQALQVEEVGIILFDVEQGLGELVAEEPPRPDPQPPPLRFALSSISSLDEFLATGQTMSLTKAQHTPLLGALRDLIAARGTHPILLIPLITRGQIIGVIYLGSTTRSFQSDEVQLAHTIANQIAGAIETAQFYETVKNFNVALGRRVQERTQELAKEKERVEFLYAIASETNASLDLNLVLERALQLVTQAAEVDRGAIILRDRETDHLVCWAAMGDGGLLDVDGSIPFRMGEGLVGWVAQHREPVVVADITQDPRWLAVPGREITYHSYLAVPIVTSEEVVGVLNLAHARRDYFTEDHLRLLNAVAQEIGSAIHNAELYRYVLAQTDQLGRLLAQQEVETSKSQAILESIADGVVFSDAGGRIILPNMAAEHILRVPAAQLRGRHIRDLVLLVDPADQPTFEAALDGLMAGRTLSSGPVQAIRLTLRIGELVTNVHLSPVITKKEEFLGVVMVFRDVTRETEADRIKTEFVSTVSHELRTPLTSIRGYVDLILDGDVGEVNDEVQDYLTVVKTNSDRLTSLVNDLLDISRIETGRVSFNLIPLVPLPLVESAVARIRPLAEERGLTTQMHVPADLPPIQADPEALAQVLDRLLSNAVKYTPAGGGQITLSLSMRSSGDMVQFDVIDTGIGIAPADQEKLFTRFFRADHPVVQFAGGTGLGLAIAKAIVDGHGGTIWAASPGPSGQGSVFSFTIPVAAEMKPWVPVSSPELSRMPARAEERPRLLVVDDDRDIIRLLYHRLRRDGYLVDTAVSGAEALARISQTRPDLIVLDVLMPGMDGYQVLEQLKADPVTADVPVVILSIVGEQERGLALGAAEYLPKPLEEQRLEKVIAEVLGRAGRVLIADDDADIVRLLQRNLQRHGFETLTATDGLAALAQARSEPSPDLILLDLRMPQLDGYQVLERLRSDAATHSIPVLIITAATPDQEAKRQRAMELGAAQFVSKPVDVEDLVATIRQIVT